MKKEDIKQYGKKKAYFPIENNRFVRTEGLIGIFDLDKTTISSVTRNFLKKAEKNGTVTTASMGLPKSFLLFDNGREEKIYLSVFSVVALEKRTVAMPEN